MRCRTRKHVADREPTRLGMGDSGRERRIEAVEVDGHVERAGGIGTRLGEVAHGDHRRAEPLGWARWWLVEGANADLDQPIGEPFLHDPGERTGVGVAVASKSS